MIVALLAVAWADTCDLTATRDAPFAEAVIADPDVRLVVEIHASGDDPAVFDALIDTLDGRGVDGALLVGAEPPEAIAARATEAAREGHEVALALPRGPVVGDERSFAADLLALKRQARAFGKRVGGRPATVASPLPRRTTEAFLGLGGYRAVLVTDGAAAAEVRRALAYQGQALPTVVLPGGPYHGDCGPDPVATPFTPRAADRATVALRHAASARGIGVVRVGVDASRATLDDAWVLARWLDEVVVPAGVIVATPTAVRDAVLAYAVDANAPAPGRYVAVDDVRAAAAVLAGADAVPRALPGHLVPTEAFLAFARLIAGEAGGGLVQLRAMRGPAAGARSMLDGPTPFARDDVTAVARALLAAPPDRVPVSMPVGGRLLSAGELLVLFASAVRGDDPPIARPVQVPEPNEDGQGWGGSQ